MIVLSNFSKTARKLPKHTVVAYATRNPLAILAIDDDTSREFEKVLNIPFVRKEENPHETLELPEDLNNPEAEKADWRESVNLSHIEDHDLRNEILAMLEKY